MKNRIRTANQLLIVLLMLCLVFQFERVKSAEKKDEVSYYSKMETPFAEIKSNVPGNEIYEATTAIPANEPLYAGFGASEFMLNLEAERKESSGTRTYTLAYTNKKCIENDDMCVIAKTTHSHACEDGKDKYGKPIIKSHTYTCGNGCPKCGNRSACKGDQHICSYKKGAVGIGCQIKKQINRQHPHSHLWKGKVMQIISDFSYMDIKGLELWQVNRLIVEGNKKLFVNPRHVINPFTGYRAFYDQEGYQNNNGRLVFSYSFQDNQRYGDTKIEKAIALPIKKQEADKKATEWMNEQIAGKRVKAKVISDFLSLTTTEGYQIPMYYEYDSDLSLLTDKRFVTGSESKVLEGNPILFSKQPSLMEMWTKNPNTAAKWSENHITRSGYNGNYANPQTKYDNLNQVTAIDKTAYLERYPNTKIKEGEKTFEQNRNNQRMVRTEINTIETIPDGFYSTGTCYLEADLEISYGKTGGVDYGRDSGLYRREVAYANGYSKVNDIIRIQTWN